MRLLSSTAAASAVALFFTVFLTACNREPQPRRYTEIAFKAKGSPMAAMEAPIHIAWTLPDGWVEQPGGDPLRLASFLAPDPELANTGDMDPRAVDVSIVQLGGNAGGIPANISRWMGQAKIPASPDLVQDILARAGIVDLATGQKGIVVDFTGVLAGDMTQNTSIVGVILQDTDYTVFIKAMGDRDRLIKLKPQILAFCRTLSISGGDK